MDEDERYLRLAGEVLEDQIDAVLDLWYGFVAANASSLLLQQCRLAKLRLLNCSQTLRSMDSRHL